VGTEAACHGNKNRMIKAIRLIGEKNGYKMNNS